MASKKKSNGRKKFFSFSRTVHIYTSSYLLGLLIFFCITGITLNHRWYGEAEPSNVKEIILEDELLDSWGLAPDEQWQPNLNLINTYFNELYSFGEPSSIDLDKDYREVMINFKVPAGFATAIILASENKLMLEVERGALLGILNDLHKGRHSGEVWFWLIDVSAVLMCVFAITGMIILFQGKKFRRSGSLLAIVGLLTPVVVFLIFVPRANL